MSKFTNKLATLMAGWKSEASIGLLPSMFKIGILFRIIKEVLIMKNPWNNTAITKPFNCLFLINIYIQPNIKILMALITKALSLETTEPKTASFVEKTKNGKK